MIAMLLMLEPIEFPSAIAGASLIIEETLTKISGMDVPKATGVPEFSWGSNLTKAELKGKGKLGERMGIGFSFNNQFYTDGF